MDPNANDNKKRWASSFAASDLQSPRGCIDAERKLFLTYYGKPEPGGGEGGGMVLSEPEEEDGYIRAE